MLTTVTYIIYLLVSICITVTVGNKLSTAGLVFLSNKLNDKRNDTFNNKLNDKPNDKPNSDNALAIAINNLLLIGFYLTNMGYILLALNLNSGNFLDPMASSGIENINSLIRFLSINLGIVMLMLGAMHLMLLWVMSNWKPDARGDVAEEQ
jgi:hypothetical protein